MFNSAHVLFVPSFVTPYHFTPLTLHLLSIQTTFISSRINSAHFITRSINATIFPSHILFAPRSFDAVWIHPTFISSHNISIQLHITRCQFTTRSKTRHLLTLFFSRPLSVHITFYHVLFYPFRYNSFWI